MRRVAAMWRMPDRLLTTCTYALRSVRVHANAMWAGLVMVIKTKTVVHAWR